MPGKTVVLVLFLYLGMDAGYAQSDSSAMNNKYTHSPVRAGVYSAVLPGWGQGYNRKYWKMPVVYAAVGTSAGFVIYNQKKFRMFKDAYIAHSVNPGLIDEFSKYTTGQLYEIQDTYHQWRDISIICMAGFYCLNILDAVVDAHFYRFDVSNDLSFHFSLLPSGTTGIGLTLRF